ncbi:MAG: UvrB/UvrC motif-containing protein [Isosphaeraceae bacterium]|nr:UvrB/UvrC motif-containing protein [Isosphaeraceae bacterium]
MSKDIGPILAGWDYNPDELQVRIITGDDGREKLQARIDLGLLQMELSGRPDGQRPEGFESYLDYLEDRARKATSDEPLVLDRRDLALLMREGVQYYHRYLALFHLERYDLVARDTARNLRLFAFVREHAPGPRETMQFDQYRPYVTMMHTKALGLQALERGDYPTALERIDEGIAAIRAFLREYDQPDREADCPELGHLLAWRHEVERNRPLGPIERLEQQLELAVTREQYEEAARLRDQIRRLRQPPGDCARFP